MKNLFEADEDDLLATSGSSGKEGIKKRARTDKRPGSPPTHDYYYGTCGRRWAGIGKKADAKNWKRKRRTQYRSD